MRPGMDSAFGLHHVAHAHNAEIGADSLAGMDARSMKIGAAEMQRSEPRPRSAAPRRSATEVRAWLAAQRARPAAAVGGHRRGVRRAPGVGAQAGRRPAGGRVLAGAIRRPGRLAGAVAGLRGGVLPRPAGRSGSARTACSCSAPTLFAHGSAEQRDRILPPMATGPSEVWAQAWSEPGAGSDLAAIRSARAVAKAELAAGCCPGRRPGARGRRSRTGRSACSAPIPGRSGTAGLTYLMFDLRAPGVTVRPIAPA